ncbi:MAG: hypothetical protein COY58_09085 [Gammaproteobacteria bacterium CG_4_10_14_0_8_um_filter_38_16]|nr:MAG: hypothetical protein COY58_09085 [Gammaproteobacteria bacterium CG_4_10_14_0_8_um_filter_38_16]PJA03395.1 MAG: hypothetical protein COX72_05520 [Gammaproteobacteria bacterium CG_4_10_14_0_2_um_filter_38_22]PJB11117.1 MAG: hypothetical protein CO120_01210 [Gammaproteobacteria bacterium CG_4_9_14_3_um_filter_38_9]
MSCTDNEIWQVTIPMPSGQLQTYRSSKTGENSRQLIPVSDKNKGALAIFMQMLRDIAAGKGICMLRHSRSERRKAPRIPYELFCFILTFNFGMTGNSVEKDMEQISTEAVALGFS